MAETRQSTHVSVYPVWQADDEVSECYLCHTTFTFFFRRHHCRRCGKVVCGNCSNTKTTYGPDSHVVSSPRQLFLESPLIPHRTCDLCVEELITNDVARDDPNILTDSSNPVEVPGSFRRPFIKDVSEQRTSHVNETDDADSDRDRCPICNQKLAELSELDKEDHINVCLINAEFSGSPEQIRHSNRMLVYHIPEDPPIVVSCSDSTLPDQGHDEKDSDYEECVICLEELRPGNKVGRLECLCVFHYKCIKGWFKQKGPGNCPVHAVHL